MNIPRAEHDPVDSLRWPAADETYIVHMLIEQHPAVLTSLRPWFIIFNAYCGEPTDGYPGEYRFHFYEPFPVEEFPPHSPVHIYEIVRQYGIGGMAHEAGYATPEEYLRDMISCAGYANLVIANIQGASRA
ncbi:MAG: hypothetical protein EOP14_00640 [Pseudomonas sp.]|jgi:hypothetical protein|nr:MAG: hypothetical protein EOP14_00640 [Pseudomonas sp.]